MKPLTTFVEGVRVECIDQRVIRVEPDGTRVVRVTLVWGDGVREADVRFSTAEWDAAQQGGTTDG